MGGTSMNITLQSNLQRFNGRLQELYMFLYLRRHLIPFLVVTVGFSGTLLIMCISWYKILVLYVGARFG